MYFCEQYHNRILGRTLPFQKKENVYYEKGDLLDPQKVK